MIALPSQGSTLAFLFIVASVIAMFCWAHQYTTKDKSGLRNALIFCVAWLAITGMLPLAKIAGSEAVNIQTAVFIIVLLSVIIVAFSAYGKRMSLGVPIIFLVSIHMFRFPLELVLHQWWRDGFLPIQMTYAGDNFDIITGCFAIILGAVLWKFKLPLWAIALFNVIGIILLARILIIVNLTNPTPLRDYFGGYTTGPQILVGLYLPYVWLPTILVSAALFFHIVLARKLFAMRLINQ